MGYRELLREKKRDLGDARDKLASGLAKLESSKSQVIAMQADLSTKQKASAVPGDAATRSLSIVLHVCPCCLPNCSTDR
jgi:formate dehydrogenase maturation protein FdhE